MVDYCKKYRAFWCGFLLVGAGLGNVCAAPNEQVMICHKPKSAAEQTLQIAQSAVPGHLKHGDVLGSCEAPPHVPCGPRTPPQPPVDTGLPVDEEEFISEAQVRVAADVETKFYAAGATLTFDLSCPILQKTTSAVSVLDNGLPVPFESLQLQDNQIVVPVSLANSNSGKHEIDIFATDIYGATISKKITIWAGSFSIPVLVLDGNGNPQANAEVNLRLADDPKVNVTLTTDATGQVQFTGLPNRSYNIIAKTADNQLATRPASVFDGQVVLRMKGFNPASAIENNDFSQGLAGWQIGSAPVLIVPHQENLPLQNARLATQPGGRNAEGSARLLALTAASAPALAPDFDLRLVTAGEGQQSISRTFAVEKGVKSVVVRFRFITTEVPGGYFGTEFNDFFNVSIRTLAGGGSTTVGNSMNGLGLAAFTADGATTWYEAELPVDANGDTVQVDIAVANVADGFLDSMVIVDGIKKKKLRVSALQLNDIDNTALGYLSASAHTYFNGETRVHGTFTINGPLDQSLEDLSLQIIGGGAMITVPLLESLRSTVYRAFGETQEIKLSASQLLFAIPATDLAAVDQATNGAFTLRVVARDSSGETAQQDVTGIQKLVRFTGNNRYGGRDEGGGGDDWAKPSVVNFITGAGLTWGDFSNMNGGQFAPHSSHRTGNSADGWFAGFNDRNAATATTIIGHLNTHGRRIQRVFVTFAENSAFDNAIRDVMLNDGRRARDVIRNEAGHTTHFHWEVPD